MVWNSYVVKCSIQYDLWPKQYLSFMFTNMHGPAILEPEFHLKHFGSVPVLEYQL